MNGCGTTASPDKIGCLELVTIRKVEMTEDQEISNVDLRI
jgi:hypothetical protein